MSTPNTRIFKKFNTIFEDSKLFSILSDQELTELFDIFLSKTRSMDFKFCKKNLSDYEEPDYYTQDFVYNGSNQFTISKYPENPHQNAITYICKVNNVDATYTFDEETLTFTVTSTLVENDNVICGYEFIGQINSDLDDEECWLCALSMNTIWLSRQINKEEKLRDKLGTKDYHNPHSPANLLDKLIELKKDSEREFRNRLISYTFNGFEGFD